jgi:hypothetical protein
MPNIIIIEKSGSVKQMNIKTFTEGELFKKAGFKSAKNFECHTIWNVEIPKLQNRPFSISLYAKNTGRAGQENKYEFPPPVDKALYFGSCVLISTVSQTNEIRDLTVNDWNSIYEYLYGGFDELNADDDTSETDDSLEEIEDIPKCVTKTGYLKDGFVVGDDDDDDITDDPQETDAESDDTPIQKIEIKPTGNRRRGAASANKITVEPPETKRGGKTKKKPAPATLETITNDEKKEDLYLDCKNELGYESYEETG